MPPPTYIVYVQEPVFEAFHKKITVLYRQRGGALKKGRGLTHQNSPNGLDHLEFGIQ